MNATAARIVQVIYILLGSVHLLLLLLHLPGHAITKCLLMPALIVLVFLSREPKRHSTGFIILLVLSLLFSWAGDIFLLGKTGDFFLAGLGSFAVAHICYIILLSVKVDRTWRKRWWRMLPLWLYFGILMYFLVPAIVENEEHHPFLYPVLFYSLLLMSMGKAALLRNSFCAWTWLGAILFIISDSMIAWNMFVGSIPLASVLIMFTYISAQLLIVKGLLFSA